ncbi:TetR/AcrR family transcriptional regulator [Streptomyces sp. NRRL B-1347]|uniref:TetR/AcrR family transcriptional regulator n=1 Tax=Streptomyces sp. NRRL B-1347 TaxID=1476877 RepID=UPI0004C75E11|nr:TetR/AcrR family transcriptional regulator [Streptomyces sp. NRRL B-1347]
MAEQGIRARQREHTRGRLVAEGRRLFAAHGYAAVGLAEIVRSAEVTKGALYHHFTDKAALFRAVLEEVQREVGRRVADAADAHDDPWTRLTVGCRAFLAATADPDVQRVMLVDGPAVLGWSAWRAMDEAASGRHLDDVLAELVDGGVLSPQPVAPLSHLLSGAMNEAALWLASSRDPEDLPRTQAALERLLDGLRAEQPGTN